MCPVGVSGFPVCCLLSLACDDALEVVAFNASSWWHEVDALGQDRAWVAERAALSTTGHSWAAEPGSEAAWLELDLGTRRNVTGESWPSDGDNSCLCPHATLTTVLPLCQPHWSPQNCPGQLHPHNSQDALEFIVPWFYWCKLGCRAHQPPWLLLSPFCPFAPLICSHFWDEQVNIMLLHLVPASIFCPARACRKQGLCAPAAGDRGEENGDIVRLEAGGGRNAGLVAGAGGYQFLGADQGIPHWNLPPKPPPRIRRIPLCQVTCPALLVLSQLGLEYPRDGSYSSWE